MYRVFLNSSEKLAYASGAFILEKSYGAANHDFNLIISL